MSRQQRMLFLVIFTFLVVVYSSFAFISGHTSNGNPDAMPTLILGNFESVIATPVPDIITVASSNTINQSEQTTISNRVDAPLPSSAFLTGDRPAPITSAPVPNQQVLTFAPYTSPMEQEAYLQSIGATVIQRIDNLNTVIVQVDRPIVPA